MKENYCAVIYNSFSNKWDVIVEMALIKDYLEFDLKRIAIKTAKEIAFKNKLELYVYDRNKTLVQKSVFI